ncbi:MAG TPA: prephenate dehydrogenase/arogenate dehydrogenase family protein [Silvibacterium sp.]|jgi:prephenate dehydrogenase|nr:prephenate dehydrogenase/arogenate dehydrogenase family protein [Silvibacterium sp.]
MPIDRIAIFGTGLIGSSVGLALRSHGYTGEIVGWDPNAAELSVAESRGAIASIAPDPLKTARESRLILLCGPVFTILEWLDRLAPILQSGQLVTDVGSVKGAVCERARARYNLVHTAGFLAGHPMAGKEVSGAANADVDLFEGAAWLFTETAESRSMHSASRALADEWRGWTKKFGCRVLDLDVARHDVLCAWVSHLPQYLSTALSALLEDEFPEKDEMLAIGGRALREMTRLGGSPFSMWRDVAHTNTAAIAESLFALEQRLAHLRENLKTPELRDEFERANRFRAATAPPKK